MWLFGITNSASMNDFVEPLIHTSAGNSSNKFLEMGLLCQQVNAFVILIDFATLPSLRSILFSTAPVAVGAYLSPHSLLNRVVVYFLAIR